MWPLTISNHNCRQNLRCWKAPLTPRHSDVVHVQNLKQIQTSRIWLPVGQPYGAMQWVVAGSLSGCRSQNQDGSRTFDNFLELFQYFWLSFGGTGGGTTAPSLTAFRSKTAAGLCSAAAARLHSAWKGAGQNKKWSLDFCLWGPPWKLIICSRRMHPDVEKGNTETPLRFT